MNAAIPTRTLLHMAILLAIGLAGTAVAVEPPPVRPEQQRSWLAGCLVADMRATGVFSGEEIAETVSLVDSLTDEQVVLFARLYSLMREIAEQDARLYTIESSETLVRLRRRIRRAYWDLVAISPRCRMLCEIAYATVPGWCARWRYAVPEWYFRGGCYVGPLVSARYARAYSVRAYRAHFDRGRYNAWRGGRTRFGGDIGRFPKAAQGIRRSHAAAMNQHSHSKPRHGTAGATRDGPPSKARHGNPVGAAKHRGPRKGAHVAAHSGKHGGTRGKANHSPSKAARQGSLQSKPARHPQPQTHRQQPKRGAHAPKWKSAAHPQHAPHGQQRHKSGHARHK